MSALLHIAVVAATAVAVYRLLSWLVKCPRCGWSCDGQCLPWSTGL